MAAPSIDDILDSYSPWDIPGRLEAIQARREQWIATGGESRISHTETTNVICYQILERPEQAEALQTLLLELHKGLAFKQAAKFHRIMPADREEYEAAAIAGLWKAITLYQPGRGAFSKWAHPFITRALVDAMQETAHPHFTKNQMQLRARVINAVLALQTRGGDEPTDAEVVAWDRENSNVRTPLGIKNVRAIRNPIKSVSIDVNIEDVDVPTTAIALTSPDSVADQVIDSGIKNRQDALVEEILGSLTPRDRLIIEAYFGFLGEPRSLQSIGDEIGLSREGVRYVVSQVKFRWADALHPDDRPAQ